ncbi:MAG: glycosyltransferase family 1 protein [Thermodesulfobacteriota bacterium]
MKKRTIIVTGLACTYPVGGVFWDYVQYLLGFLRLGHDCYYLEDSGKWTYDCEAQTYTGDASRNVAWLMAQFAALAPELTGRFCVRDANNTYWGLDAQALSDVVKRADLFLNISCNCQLRDEYLGIPVKALIDSDPLYTQEHVPPYLDGTLDEPTTWTIDQLRKHDLFFSFGENIGRPGCLVPAGIFDWRPTRQPVVLDCWDPATLPDRTVFNTVMSWQPAERGPLVAGVQYGGKDFEFMKLMGLPGKTTAALELAIGGGLPPWETLMAAGWRLVDGWSVSRDPFGYRDYLRSGLGEFSTAKNAYVASRSGWFSCRSACYMALGRPVVVQDTGFSGFIPTGEGVLAFSDEAGALAGLEAVRSDWGRHARAARRIAEQEFDSAKVLGRLLAEAGL